MLGASITCSSRTGAYTAKLELPSAPVRILKRADLPSLRHDVIAQVQRWANDEWRKPVRLQVEDPAGRWVLGIPRAGQPVQLAVLPPSRPALRTVSPAADLDPLARRRPAWHVTSRPRRYRLLVAAIALLLFAAFALAGLLAGGSLARSVPRRPAATTSPPVSSSSPTPGRSPCISHFERSASCPNSPN